LTPVEDKLTTHETDYISLQNPHAHMSPTATKQHTSIIRAAYYSRTRLIRHHLIRQFA